MPPPTATQGMLRHPLTAILGSEGHVRLLRELLRHGGELGATDLAARAGLSPQHARLVLAHLVETGVAEELGAGRARLYRARRAHPLVGPLDALFAAEDERFGAVLAAVRRATAEIRPRPPRAVWLYGSAARGTDTAANQRDHAAVRKALRAALGNRLPAAQERRLARILGYKDEAQYGAGRIGLTRARQLLEVSNDIRNPASGDAENPATPVTPTPRPEPARCRA